MAGYNRTREVEELLERTESQPPSFTVHLHPEYWALNNGSKFLYNNHIASLLDDIRAHRIPVDFLELFDMARVPFYDGCMIVELLDYRPQKHKDPSPDKPDRTRVVLHPDSETLWADICLLNKKHGNTWTDMDALEAESRILLATAPPLCLDPNPHLTRIANHILRVSTPAVPTSLKRKAAELEREEDEVEKTRRHRLMSFMNPRSNALQTPSYRILDTIKRLKQAKDAASSQPQQPQPNIPIPSLAVNTAATAPSVLMPTSAQSSIPPSPQKPTMALKKEGLERASNSPRPRSSATPLPQPHLQVAHTPAASSPAAASPVSHQPVANSVDVAHRTPTPSQTQYTHSPRVPPIQPHAQPIARPPSSQHSQPPRPQSRLQAQAQAHPQPHPPIPRPPTAQPQVPFPTNASGHFTQGSPALRQAKVPTPQPNQHHPQTAQAAQLMYMHHLQQQQQLQQQHQARIAVAQQQALHQQQQPSGRSTPQASQPTMTNAQNVASPANRASPLTARSMTPQAGGQQVPLPPHLAQHAQQQQQQLANLQHFRQNPQFAVQLAAAVAGGARPSASPLQPNVAQQQQQQAQAHMQAQQAAAVNTQHQQAQAQAHVVTYPQQMLNYAQMGLMRPGLPPNYWMTRVPVAGNGQAISGMPQGMVAPNGANPQALGVQKAGQAGQAR